MSISLKDRAQRRLALLPPPLAVAGMASYPDTKQMRAEFEFKNRFKREMRMWLPGEDGTILVPREAVPPPDDPGADFRSDGAEADFACDFTPRNEDQLRVINEAYPLLRVGRSFVIRCPTRFGKTPTTLVLIANLGLKTLVVVNKEDLLDRWREDAIKILGMGPSEIGIIRANKVDADHDLVLAFCQSIWSHDRYPDEVFDDFGLVVFDEVDRFATEKFQYACGRVPAKLRLGLSATPQRVDGNERIFEAHIGPVLVESDALPMVPKVLTFDTGWHIPSRVVDGEWEEIPHGGREMGHVWKMLGGNAERNKLICECVRMAWEKDRHTLVMTDFKRHLETIEVGLRAMNIPERDVGWYVGGMSTEARDAAKAKKVVLCTYAMSSVGTDIPWASALVMATPKANVEQIIGRVCSQWDDKPEPVIFDLRDHSRELYNYARKRDSIYKRLGAEVKNMTVGN